MYVVMVLCPAGTVGFSPRVLTLGTLKITVCPEGTFDLAPIQGASPVVVGPRVETLG
jgi:hypothetical protein